MSSFDFFSFRSFEFTKELNYKQIIDYYDKLPSKCFKCASLVVMFSMNNIKDVMKRLINS